MHYKLVVADDEDIIRDGICSIIDWEALGFEIAADFDDGKEVIEYISKNAVDAVLVDIRMYNVSGLEVAEYIHRNKLDVKIVIISGYKDFEYAKKSIEYGVFSYITKPIDYDEFTCIFNELKTFLDKDKDKQKENLFIKKRYEQVLPMLQEQFFTDLILGVVKSEQEIIKRIKMAELRLNPYNNPCFLVNIYFSELENYITNQWKRGNDAFKVALHNSLSSKSDETIYIPLLNNHQDMSMMAISHGNDIEYAKDKVIRFLDEKKNAIKKLMGIDMDYEIKASWPNILKLAENHLKNNAFKDREIEDNSKSVEMDRYQSIRSKQVLFLPYINAGDKEAVNNLMDNYLSEMKELSLREICYFIIELFNVITSSVSNLGINLSDFRKEEMNFHEILLIKNKEEVKQWCIHKMNLIFKALFDEKTISKNLVILKAEEYINENYNKDISLDEVASSVYLSSVYFCQFFKECTGLNYSDYLSKIRIQKAKTLLKDSRYKVQEVGNMVGYPNSKYFATVFKKYCKLSPTEYRAYILQKGEIDEK